MVAKKKKRTKPLKITVELVDFIFDLLDGGWSHKEIACECNTSYQKICWIIEKFYAKTLEYDE